MDRSLTQKKSSETTSLTFNGRYELTILFIMVILLAISVFPLRSSAAPKQTDSGKALTIPSGSPAVSAPLSKFATTPPAKSSPPAGTGTSLAAELNITINKIFLKNNKIFIEMNGMDGRRMNPEDFVKMTLRLETVKGQRKWNLADIDKAKSLMNGGRFEFDTGIVLDKSEVVKALLSLGKIEKMKHEMLSISPVSSIMSTAPISAAKQVKKAGDDENTGLKRVGTIKATTARPRTTVPSPVLMNIYSGIRVSAPVAGMRFRPGETINVTMAFGDGVTPAALQSAVLLREATEVARLSEGSLPAPSREMSFSIPIPAGVTTSDYYSVLVTAAGGYSGQSDVFYIGPYTPPVVDSSHGVRVYIEGNPVALTCGVAHPLRIELNAGVEPGLHVASSYYPGGSMVDSIFLHQSSAGRDRMGLWGGIGWEPGSLVVAGDYRSMAGRVVPPCVAEGSGYVITFNHTTGVYGDSPSFTLGTGEVSLTVLEPGKGGEHFTVGQVHPVRWEYHAPITASTGPSDWQIEFHSFDIPTGTTRLVYTLIPVSSAVTFEEVRRGRNRVFSYYTTFNTSHLAPGNYKIRIIGGGTEDWGSLVFSMGNSGAYDLSISGIEWDEASHQLVAEVQNPDRITGAIDFRVEHGMESSRVPTIFPSSETVSRIGLGAPGELAGRDRFADCRPVYTVTIDDSNRVDERNETNNSFTGRIGYSSAIGIYLLRYDAYEYSTESQLSATPGDLDWDYKGNGNTIIFRLRVRNCGARTVEGTIEISQEACFPGSGGGRICYTPEVRLVRSQSLSIGSTHEGIIDVTQEDLAETGSDIIIRFSGDIAAYAPANPVRIHMRD